MLCQTIDVFFLFYFSEKIFSFLLLLRAAVINIINIDALTFAQEPVDGDRNKTCPKHNNRWKCAKYSNISGSFTWQKRLQIPTVKRKSGRNKKNKLGSRFQAIGMYNIRRTLYVIIF